MILDRCAIELVLRTETQSFALNNHCSAMNLHAVAIHEVTIHKQSELENFISVVYSNYYLYLCT